MTRIVLATMLVLVLILTSCGSKKGGTTSVTTVATSATASTTVPPPNLTADLLSLSDLPTGWSVDNSPDTSSSEPACFQSLKNHAGSNAKADVKYNGGANGLPSLEEALGNFPTGATTVLAQLDQVLSACKTITIKSDRQTFTGTIGAMSFPQIGQESHTYQVSFSYKGFTFGFDLLLARTGNVLMAMYFGDLGSPDVGQLQMFASKAIAKVG